METNGGLSRRQRQVCDLLLLGRNTKEIAQALWITPRTARHHLDQARGRFTPRPRNRIELIVRLLAS